MGRRGAPGGRLGGQAPDPILKSLCLPTRDHQSDFKGSDYEAASSIFKAAIATTPLPTSSSAPFKPWPVLAMT